MLSADQSRFLDDTRQDCGRGVAWAGALGRFVGPFPGCFPCRLTRQEVEYPGANCLQHFSGMSREHRRVCRVMPHRQLLSVSTLGTFVTRSWGNWAWIFHGVPWEKGFRV